MNELLPNLSNLLADAMAELENRAIKIKDRDLKLVNEEAKSKKLAKELEETKDKLKLFSAGGCLLKTNLETEVIEKNNRITELENKLSRALCSKNELESRFNILSESMLTSTSALARYLKIEQGKVEKNPIQHLLSFHEKIKLKFGLMERNTETTKVQLNRTLLEATQQQLVIMKLLPGQDLSSKRHGVDLINKKTGYHCYCLGSLWDFGNGHLLNKHLDYIKCKYPYKCLVCKKRFRAQEHLDTHANRHLLIRSITNLKERREMLIRAKNICVRKAITNMRQVKCPVSNVHRINQYQRHNVYNRGSYQKSFGVTRSTSLYQDQTSIGYATPCTTLQKNSPRSPNVTKNASDDDDDMMVIAHIRLGSLHDDNFVCKTCNRSFKRAYTLKNHIRRVHKLEIGHSAECKFCGTVFPTGLQLIRHEVNSHFTNL